MIKKELKHEAIHIMGICIVFLTFIVASIYTVLELRIIAITGDLSDVLFRISGILFFASFAYIPYLLMSRVISLINYKLFFVGIISVFVFVDILLRIAIVFDFPETSGFFNVLGFSVLFSVVIIIAYFLDKYIYHYTVLQYLSNKLRYSAKKVYQTLVAYCCKLYTYRNNKN